MVTVGKALADRSTDLADARAVVDHARMLRVLGAPAYQVATAQHEAHLSIGLCRLSSDIAAMVVRRATLCPCKTSDQCVCVPPF